MGSVQRVNPAGHPAGEGTDELFVGESASSSNNIRNTYTESFPLGNTALCD